MSPDRPQITALDTVVALASRRGLRGAARLRRLLRGHHNVTLTRVQTTDGLLLDIDAENVMDFAVLKDGYYEREVIDAIVDRLAPNGVLWDVGANIGLHTVTAKRMRPGATVVAFEPAPHTTARLIGNIDLNGLDVQVVAAALSETDGVARLSVVTRGNSGLSSLRPWPDVEYERTILCPCVRADSLVESGVLPAPTVVKLDVEGFEVEVLRGFGDLLESPELRTIVFEAPGGAASQSPPHPVCALLATAGFSISPLPPSETSERRVATNYVATKL